VVQANQCFLGLSAANVGVEQAHRGDAAKRAIGAGQPSACSRHAAESCRSDMGNVGKPVEPVRLDRGEQTLVSATRKRPAGDADHGTDGTRLQPEGSG
jgi:hypothetical protein